MLGITRFFLLDKGGTQQAQEIGVARERIQCLATNALCEHGIARAQKRLRAIERGFGGILFVHGRIIMKYAV